MEMGESSYNLLLVGLSYLISVFGAYAALQLAVGIQTSRGLSQWGWLVAAAIAMGGGAIWSMHFIGMLAYQMPMQVVYDTYLTLVSLLIGILAAGVGLFVVGRESRSIPRLLLAGVFTGLGVSGMHYTGMAAMQMSATVSYRPGLVVLSVLIGVVASIAALWLAFNLRGNLQRLSSAFVMGAAVCGMHYTGMSAAVMTPNGASSVPVSAGLRPEGLGTSIFLISFLLLTVALLASLARAKAEPSLEF